MGFQLQEPLSIVPAALPAAEPAAGHDRELLRRIAARDAEALGTFFDRWEACVRAFVAPLFPTAEAREAAVEAVFWAVWQQAGTFGPGAARVEGWLHAIALACCRVQLAGARADVALHAGAPAA